MVRKSCLRSRVEEKILLPQFDKVPVEPECSGQDKEYRKGLLECSSTGYQLTNQDACLLDGRGMKDQKSVIVLLGKILFTTTCVT